MYTIYSRLYSHKYVGDWWAEFPCMLWEAISLKHHSKSPQMYYTVIGDDVLQTNSSDVANRLQHHEGYALNLLSLVKRRSTTWEFTSPHPSLLQYTFETVITASLASATENKSQYKLPQEKDKWLIIIEEQLPKNICTTDQMVFILCLMGIPV